MIGLFAYAVAAEHVEAQPISFDEAFGTFESVCVVPLPSSIEFLKAKDSSNIDWKERKKSDDSLQATGYEWGSTIGILSYQKREENRFTLTNPSCHLAFLTDDSFDFQNAADLISIRFNSSPGNWGEGKKAQGYCWDAALAESLPVRLYLQTADDFQGRSAVRLSIAKRLAVDPQFLDYVKERGGLVGFECKAKPKSKQKKTR